VGTLALASIVAAVAAPRPPRGTPEAG
jgi:hypothetical protein